MNSVAFTGRLVADVKEKEINGKSLCEFMIACGQKDKTIFLPAQAWNMGHLPKYLHKGSKILLQGFLKQDNWETEHKEKRSRISVVALNVEFLDPPIKKG